MIRFMMYMGAREKHDDRQFRIRKISKRNERATQEAVV